MAKILKFNAEVKVLKEALKKGWNWSHAPYDRDLIVEDVYQELLSFVVNLPHFSVMDELEYRDTIRMEQLQPIRDIIKMLNPLFCTHQKMKVSFEECPQCGLERRDFYLSASFFLDSLLMEED